MSKVASWVVILLLVGGFAWLATRSHPAPHRGGNAPVAAYTGNGCYPYVDSQGHTVPNCPVVQPINGGWQTEQSRANEGGP